MFTINVRPGQTVRFNYLGPQGVEQREVTVERVYKDGPTRDRFVGRDKTRDGAFRSFLYGYICTEPVLVS